MGLEFHYRVLDLASQATSTETRLAVAPQGPLLLISADNQSYLQASPRLLAHVVGGTEGPQISYVLATFPPAGRYTLLARLEHEDHVFLTDFIVDLP